MATKSGNQPAMTGKRTANFLTFALMAVVLLWWRAHTFAPAIDMLAHSNLWPEMSGPAEPLDCDEAAYGYMARRMADGAALYKDVTEYKPPGGYWFYFLAITLGGASEMTVRLMVLPVLVATLWLVGATARRFAGMIGAVFAMAAFVLMSTDPYVFGNGSNLEHLMNLFGIAAVWSFLNANDNSDDEREADASSVTNLRAEQRVRLFWLFVCGICVGLAATVKQVALIALVPIVFEFARSKSQWGGKLWGIFVTFAGFLVPWIIAGCILAAQGALADAFADVIEYSRALAKETPADANAPSIAFRWLTGNSDPRNGSLPWPFGRTDWLVWWGTGAWPLHLFAAACFLALILIRPFHGNPTQRILIWQYPLAWCMIALPGLYWQHYYLLLTPVSCLFVGILTGIVTRGAIRSPHAEQLELTGSNQDLQPKRVSISLKYMTLAAGAIVTFCMTARIQWIEYLTVPAEKLTVKYKGGTQWVSLRQLGVEISQRTVGWNPRPLLEVWGWQSPLLFYSGLDAPDRYFFTDPLAKAMIGKPHPLVGPRMERLMESLRAKRPELIFCGDIPFPELKSMLVRDYVASYTVGSTPDGRGLFVRKDRYQDFHEKTDRTIDLNRKPR